MADNDLRQQIERAQAQANAIRTSGVNQQPSVEFRPSKISNFDLNSEVPFRNSRSLSEGTDLVDGINFAADDGKPL